MHTEDYDKALKNAEDIACLNCNHMVESTHLFLGILYVENSPICYLLNEYGINIEWFYKVNPYLKQNKFQHSNNELPYSSTVKTIIKLSKNLISKNNLDISHLTYTFLKYYSLPSSMIKIKLSQDEYKSLVCKIDKLMFKKLNNQVTIE